MPSLSIVKEVQLNRVSFKERSIEKIKNSQVLDRLLKYCDGTYTMEAKCVDAHFKILDKVLPNLMSQSVTVDVNHNLVDIHTLNARLAALGHDPETVFKRISTNQVIEAESVDNLLVECEQPVEEITSESTLLEDPPTPDL